MAGGWWALLWATECHYASFMAPATGQEKTTQGLDKTIDIHYNKQAGKKAERGVVMEKCCSVGKRFLVKTLEDSRKVKKSAKAAPCPSCGKVSVAKDDLK